MTSKAPLSPEAIGIKYLPTDHLHPNPHNPRMLFDREPLDILKGSIAKVGILVPLTVYREESTGKHFILDGQRRWLCAQELHLPRVPVNQVREPTLVQNIVTMFTIHKLRQDWELMPTALKLDVLMKHMKETSPVRLAALTGLDQAVVVRCKKLLTFPKKYQDKMLDADPAERVKADFFIELHAVISDRAVRKMSWFKRDTFTDQMLKRYEAKKLRSVTEFRVIKQHISNAAKSSKLSLISRRLQEFAANPDLPVSHLEVASTQATARKLSRQVEALHSAIRNLDIEAVYGEVDLWKSLESLVDLIRQKLKQAARRPI